MTLFHVLLWGLLFSPLDGNSVIPEHVAVRARMLFLKPEMNASQVMSVLRVNVFQAFSMGFTLNSIQERERYTYGFNIGKNHVLLIEQRRDSSGRSLGQRFNLSRCPYRSDK
jgi:hypothetical protein